MELRNTFVYVDSSFLCSFFGDKEISRIPESEMNNIQPCGILTNLLIKASSFTFLSSYITFHGNQVKEAVLEERRRGMGQAKGL